MDRRYINIYLLLKYYLFITKMTVFPNLFYTPYPFIDLQPEKETLFERGLPI